MEQDWHGLRRTSNCTAANGDNQTECGSVEELLQVRFMVSHLLFILSTIQCNANNEVERQ